jgi:hypothetical protein
VDVVVKIVEERVCEVYTVGSRQDMAWKVPPLTGEFLLSRRADAHVADVVRDRGARGSCRRAKYDNHARRHATRWAYIPPRRVSRLRAYAASANVPIVAARGVRVQVPPPTRDDFGSGVVVAS